jgi:mannose-6-phosphate isomerase
MPVGPVICAPIYKPKLWGGREMARLLNKPLPGEEPIGESWELADLEDDQSVVVRGATPGWTLARLVAEWGADLTGRAPLVDGRFPLLIKFLDARETLSVQVHPTEAVARRLGGRVRVKHEAWYVVDAAPGAVIYRGVWPGVDEAALRAAIAAGRVEPLLNRIPARKGHCYYLPSGTLHALGAGVVVAEVQTPSDVTYRVDDWGRVDPNTGAPRELHIEQALPCIEYTAGPTSGERIEHTASVWTTVSSLVQCESFVIERVRMVEGVEQVIPHQELVIWIVLAGRGTIRGSGFAALDFEVGDTVLIPAAIKDGSVTTHASCMWLEVTVPITSDLAGFDRPSAEELRRVAPGYVQLGVRPPNGADRREDS